MSSFIFHVVLDQPEIPNNTGNIGRSCVGFNCDLHLIEPLGFELSDKKLKRAGLDYWKDLTYKTHSSWDHWEKQLPDKKRVYYLSTKGKKPIENHQFEKGDWLVFGAETKGISKKILNDNPDKTLTIQCEKYDFRSFNLSNAVAITLYEGIKQLRARQLL